MRDYLEDEGGPAFPVPESDKEGMTLRDWFAGQALQGLMTHAFLAGEIYPSDYDIRKKWVVSTAYDYAEAMLEEKKDL